MTAQHALDIARAAKLQPTSARRIESYTSEVWWVNVESVNCVQATLEKRLMGSGATLRGFGWDLDDGEFVLIGMKGNGSEAKSKARTAETAS